MRKSLIFILLVFISGCASMGMPGSITETVSQFDNTKEITMEPAWLYGGSGAIKIGLYKKSKMETDSVVMTAVVRGTHIFDDKGLLQFNIDGEIVVLESFDNSTIIETVPGMYTSVYSFPAYNESSKRFLISKDFIFKLLGAEKVWVKVEMQRDYVDGEFSKDYPSLARPAFRKFYEKIWGIEKGN